MNFNRNARRMEHAAGLFEQGSTSAVHMPDEIDGDDRLGASGRSTKFENVLMAVSEDESYSMDESMYIGAEEVDGFPDGGERLRRYSVIGNDPSFKQYTKNHDYDELKY